MNSAQTVAVWGSPQSGKTTITVKLALELAERKKNVIIVSDDITVPNASVLMPFEKNEKSMGELWMNPETDENAVLKQCMTTNSPYVVFLGYRHGENVFSYAAYTKKGILNTFRILRKMADYILVDCTSNFPESILTTVALELSEHVIRMCGPGLKDYSFFDSTLPMLSDSRFQTEKHILVLAKSKWFHAKDIAVSKYGGNLLQYDYKEQLEKEMAEGEGMKPSQTTEKSLKKNYEVVIQLADEITGDSSRNQKTICAKTAGEKKEKPEKLKKPEKKNWFQLMKKKGEQKDE